MNTVVLLLSAFLMFWQGAIIIARVINNSSVYALSFLMFAIGATGIAAHFFGLY